MTQVGGDLDGDVQHRRNRADSQVEHVGLGGRGRLQRPRLPMDCLLLAQDQVELDVGVVGHGASSTMVVGSTSGP